MPYANRWWVVAAIVIGLGTSACGKSSGFDSEAASDEGPAQVEAIKGSDVAQVRLSAKAAQRLGIETAAIRSEPRGKVIPYAAVLYDADGHAFAYTSPKRLVYVRHPIEVRRIDGHAAILSKGPPSGTAVVTVGAAELLGAEYGVEE
jgi:hypothetical protein